MFDCEDLRLSYQKNRFQNHYYLLQKKYIKNYRQKIKVYFQWILPIAKKMQHGILSKLILPHEHGIIKQIKKYYLLSVIDLLDSSKILQKHNTTFIVLI